LGGDEFVVLMPSLAQSTTALDLAEKIRQAVREPCTVEEHQLLVTCSMGIAVYPEDGTDEISLTRSADEAMYRAKDGGRDSVLPKSSQL
jgi:diguanylate cyclase (GGDEF)-like protein